MVQHIEDDEILDYIRKQMRVNRIKMDPMAQAFFALDLSDEYYGDPQQIRAAVLLKIWELKYRIRVPRPSQEEHDRGIILSN